MLKKPWFMFVCVLLLVGSFCYGVGRIFILRYERGDDYPAYSTLRTDSLGTKGLYDALDQLPELDVRRNFRPLPRLKPEGPITLVYPGVTYAAMWEARELQHFQSLVVDGTRGVFTFIPIQRKLMSDEEKRVENEQRARHEKALKELKEKAEKKPDGKKPKNSEEKKVNSKAGDEDKPPGKDDEAKPEEKSKTDEEDEEDEEDPETITMVSFANVSKRWGAEFDFLPPDKDDAPRVAVLADKTTELEPEIVWRSVLCFKDLAPEWRVLYRCEDRPVIIERSFGRGSIVLVADSFFLTNEGLRDDHYPKLLARLLDGPATFIFDEDHHGVKETPGIASLTRKYRLHGVVFGLFVIAVLFIWKNAASFIPAYPDDTRDGDIVAGKESAEGFVNLLRRTIKPAELIALCGAEWRKSTTHRGAEQARVEEILSEDQVRPPRERNPVATYQSIAQTLTRR
jgi:hypothetical protein